MAELRWYDFRGPCGTITIKATSEATAREEAAERWNCGENEIVCTGHTPFFGGRRLW
jgi:hypothetical protein